MMLANGKMQKENDNGPRIDPCRTPKIREAVVGEHLLTLTNKVPDNQGENRSNTEPKPAKTLSILSKIL